MTNNQLAENSIIQLLNSVKLARDNAERADNRVDHSFYYALTIALEELQERRKAAMDSEPVAEVYQTPNVGICAALGPSIRMLCALEPGTKLYRHAQPVTVVPDELKEAAADFLTVLDEFPEQLVPINRDSAVVRAMRAAMLQGSNYPVVPDGYVMVPINMTTEQMRAVQRDSTLGTFASAHLKGAFDLYREFWSVAVAASPQEVRKSNVVDTYQGADGKEHEIIYLTSSQKEVK